MVLSDGEAEGGQNVVVAFWSTCAIVAPRSNIRLSSHANDHTQARQRTGAETAEAKFEKLTRDAVPLGGGSDVDVLARQRLVLEDFSKLGRHGRRLEVGGRISTIAV